MRTLDTTSEAHAAQLGIYRRMTVGRKLELACELCDLARERTLRGIQARNPTLSPAEARAEMLRDVLGEEAYAAAFGNLGRQVA
jgi:hypothetical protein